MQLLQNILTFARENPDSPAISKGGSNPETLSYREFTSQVARLEELLLAEAAKADFAFVIAGRTPALASAIVAGLFAGIPLAIIDPRLGNHRIAQLLSLVDSSYGLVDPLGERVLSGLSAEQLQGVRYSSIPTGAESHVNDGEPRILPISSPATSPAVILFTSGSTGSPKGVKISHADLDQRLETEIAWFEMQRESRILGVLPLSFDVGLTQMLGTFYSGGHHILLGSWFPKDILSAIEGSDPEGLALSPVVWKNLLKFSDRQTLWSSINKLRYVTLSGGTLGSDELQLIAENLTQCSFIRTYGQTEMFRISSLKVQDNPQKLGSVGRAYPGVEIEIVDENGNLCGPNIPGEVVASGSGLMLGYVSDSGVQIGKRFTGDQGMLDEDGYLYLKGRKDDMVKILDQRIYPDDVAEEIRAITGLSSVVVIAVEEGGEHKLVAFVSRDHLSDEERAPSENLLRLLRQQLASHLVPGYLIDIDVFPHTVSGKIDKVELKEIFHRFLRATGTVGENNAIKELQSGN